MVLRCGKNLLCNILIQLINTLYDTNGVQSYGQRDRMILFQLLLYFFENFFAGNCNITNIKKFNNC